ncbi:MAG: FAD-binding oxidoreductase [Acidobacteriota bacterium]
MASATISTLSGNSVSFTESDLQGLSERLRGSLAFPGESAYEEARTIWNAMIDRHPGLIVRCLGASDVKQAVKFAREGNLLLSVRGGGHNIAGNAVCDGGLAIDLSPMKSVRVDPVKGTARVEPGNTLRDFDREAQSFGLATPLGINSTTGVSGLTLGGGFGWLTRKHGLTVDNLLSADIVTADGELLKASAEENPDLFWGIRGGGGNFGVATSFEFRLHRVGPQLLAGLIVYPFSEAESVLKQYRRFMDEASEELSVFVVLRKAPPLPFLPQEVHGREVLVLALIHAGDPGRAERAIKPLTAMGTPIATAVMPHEYTVFQTAFDPLLTPGARNYWKSHDFNELSDGIISTLLGYVAQLPSPECEIFIGNIAGAMSRVPRDETAYGQRGIRYVMNVHGRWRDPGADDECIGWARAFFEAAAPFSAGTAYVNFMTEDEKGRVQAAYGPHYQRLVELKRKYDPQNRFRLNQNIQPAA